MIQNSNRRAAWPAWRQIVTMGALALAVCFGLPSPAAAEPCEPQWLQDTFCEIGLNGAVLASVSWDDGTGEALYVGGFFTTSGCGAVVNNIAKWDGRTWTPLTGPGGTGVDNTVWSLTVFDDGSGPMLYVGGDFTNAGGVRVNNIAKWDGHDWSPLLHNETDHAGVGGDRSTVHALTVFDEGSGPMLYVGGDFTRAGGLSAHHIARWDGTNWSGVGTFLGSPPPSVYSFAVFDDGSGPALYVGGVFRRVGTLTVNNIARWDGADWSALNGPNGTGIGGDVYALTVFDDGTGPALYAGGRVSGAGGIQCRLIARWNGAEWSALTEQGASASNNLVYALAVYDDGSGPSLYAGGEFTAAGGLPVNGAARWDGSSWSPMGGPEDNGTDGWIFAFSVFDAGAGPILLTFGNFTAAGGHIVNNIAAWDGQFWSALFGQNGMGVNNRVSAFTVFDDGTGPDLYVGGEFTLAGGVANYVARWNGKSWSALSGPNGIGTNGAVLALQMFDDGNGPAIYAGGTFTTAGGVTVNGIARWDGQAWSALSGPSGTGVNGIVRALAVYDDGSGPALYAGGFFNTAGGISASRIARWDGTSWSSLSSLGGIAVINATINALTVFDSGFGPELYAGGLFTNVGPITANRIARWNGKAWASLTGPNGTGVNGPVNALAVYDDGSGPALYAAGNFATSGGLTTNRIAKWNGSTWSSLDSPSGIGVNNIVLTLAVANEESEQELFVGGLFTNAGGVSANRVARWNGNAWLPLMGPNGNGANNWIWALSMYNDGTGSALYAGGDFTTTGGVSSSRIAAWKCREPCPADLTGSALDGVPDGIVNDADLEYFVSLWLDRDPQADLAGPELDAQPDGSVNAFDLNYYITLWLQTQGDCP